MQRSKQNRKLKANMESLREDMAEIGEEQQRIKDGQTEIRRSFEEIESQCDQLNKETSLILRQTLYNQQRLCLIFKIIKAREDNDFSMATEHTRLLRSALSVSLFFFFYLLFLLPNSSFFYFDLVARELMKQNMGSNI